MDTNAVADKKAQGGQSQEETRRGQERTIVSTLHCLGRNVSSHPPIACELSPKRLSSPGNVELLTDGRGRKVANEDGLRRGIRQSIHTTNGNVARECGTASPIVVHEVDEHDAGWLAVLVDCVSRGVLAVAIEL
jgi:hypothetical protein